MDTRETLGVYEDFSGIIRSLVSTGMPANILFDHNGLERTAGCIIRFDESSGNKSIHLNNGLELKLEWIVAINGTFRSNYSEC